MSCGSPETAWPGSFIVVLLSIPAPLFRPEIGGQRPGHRLGRPDVEGVDTETPEVGIELVAALTRQGRIPLTHPGIARVDQQGLTGLAVGQSDEAGIRQTF